MLPLLSQISTHIIELPKTGGQFILQQSYPRDPAIAAIGMYAGRLAYLNWKTYGPAWCATNLGDGLGAAADASLGTWAKIPAERIGWFWIGPEFNEQTQIVETTARHLCIITGLSTSLVLNIIFYGIPWMKMGTSTLSLLNRIPKSIASLKPNFKIKDLVEKKELLKPPVITQEEKHPSKIKTKQTILSATNRKAAPHAIEREKSLLDHLLGLSIIIYIVGKIQNVWKKIREEISRILLPAPNNASRQSFI